MRSPNQPWNRAYVSASVASAGGGGGAPTPPPELPTIPGLFQHYLADDISTMFVQSTGLNIDADGATFQRWMDQSGIVSAPYAPPPYFMYNATGVTYHASINGYPAVNVKNRMQCAQNVAGPFVQIPIGNTSAVTLFVAASLAPTDTNHIARPLEIGMGGNPGQGLSFDTTAGRGGAYATGSGYNALLLERDASTGPRVMAGSYLSSGYVKCWLNGVFQSEVAAPGLGAFSVPTMGGYMRSGNSTAIYIHEAIAAAPVLTDEMIGLVNAYLVAKYGLA